MLGSIFKGGSNVGASSHNESENPTDCFEPFLQLDLAQNLLLCLCVQRQYGKDPPSPGRTGGKAPVVLLNRWHSTVMGENPLLHLLVVIVEPGEGGLLGLVVETLEGFKFRVFRQIVFEKLDGRRAVAILRPSVNHLKSAPSHRVND